MKFDNLKEKKLYCMIVRYNLFCINVLCVGDRFYVFLIIIIYDESFIINIYCFIK